MKNVILIFISVLFFYSARSQYYLRGEIKDENNSLLPNVRILLHSSGYTYQTGNSGAFGIPVPEAWDSITLSAEGFQTLLLRVHTPDYQNIVLKMTSRPPAAAKKRLLSFTKDLKASDQQGWSIGSETYSSMVENAFIPARRFPETGFAINLDKASYSNVRRFLNMGSTVPPDAVRIEELLNYFNCGYTAPGADSPFTFRSRLSACPWNPASQLLYLQVCARKIDASRIPPANLVFLIDVSGSMDLPNKLPLIKSAFSLLINNLREIDTVSIVTYGSSVAVWLQPTSGADRKTIQTAIDELSPGGPTPGEAGIRAAYRLAKSKYREGGNNRVILATDGDFNVGEYSEEELEKLVTLHKQWGIYLTCLGVGMGNYKDSKLEALAKKGNGNFAYLDDEKEAEKVLVREFTQTVYAVADDAYVNISFNPALVKDYRLIGFDNKAKLLSDSLAEVQGGEVGSGQSLLALFEILPAGADSIAGSGDRVTGETGKTASGLKVAGEPGGSLAQVHLNYKLPHDSVARSCVYSCPFLMTPFMQLPPCYRFASSVALFGGLLKHSRFTRQVGWKDAILLAQQSGDPEDGMQQEFVNLILRAKKIYGREKKNRKKDD